MSNGEAFLNEASSFYKKIMKPYKKWREFVYMTMPLACGGEQYRVLAVGRGEFRRFHVVTSDGEAVRDAELVRDLLGRFFMVNFLEGTEADVHGDVLHNQGGEFSHVKDAAYLLLKLDLDGADLALVQEQIRYYEDVVQTFGALSEAASRCLELLNKVREPGREFLDEGLARELEEALVRRGELRSRLEYLLIAREYEPFIELLAPYEAEAFVVAVLDETRGAKEIAARTWEQIEHSDWPFYAGLIGDEFARFSREKALEVISQSNEYLLLLEANLNLMMREKWVFA